MMKKITQNKTFLFYAAALFLTCIPMVLSNTSYDTEYQIAMAYRFIKGDRFIIQMWEPHQSSVLLPALLMKIYMTLTGTTTGIVLYLQVAGLVIRGIIAYLLYRMLQRVTDQMPALIAGLLFFLLSPKDLVMPEFSNLQLWFATLLLFCLLEYLSKKKLIFLILSAICLCFGVLSYPSLLIAYFAAIIILWKFSPQKVRDILILTGICAGIGGSFVGYLLVTIGPNTVFSCIRTALSLEPTHTVPPAVKTLSHLKGALITILIPTFFVLLGWGFEKIIGLFSKSFRRKSTRYRFVLIGWYLLLLLFLYFTLIAENRGANSYPYLFVMFFGFLNRGLLTKEESKVYFCAFLIGLSNLLSTLILSDHAFIQAVPYALVFFCLSILPLYRLYRQLREDRIFVKMFLLGTHMLVIFMMFRSFYLINPISGRGQIYTVFRDCAFIRSGPGIGVYTDEEGAAAQRDSMAEWKKYIKPGDKIWILGEPVDTLGYLYEDVEVAAPSVMSTPTYNEDILYYFELNPDKMPDVVIMASGFGTLTYGLLSNEWLLNWIDEEYCPQTVIDGNYWRYCFKEHRTFD